MKIWSNMHKEYCGIFGVHKSPEAAETVYLGLYSLQHRGQEGAGIVSGDNGKFCIEKGEGLVNEVFTGKSLENLKGNSAIGHVRYSTTSGRSSIENVQPLTANYMDSPIAIAHNGNIVSANAWKAKLEKEGVIFSTRSDSELILKMIVREDGDTWEEKLRKVLNRLKGAFSLLLFFPNKMIAVRDSYGLRPLSIGRKDGSLIISSETCAFEIVDAKYERDIKPGEIFVADSRGERSLYLDKRKSCPCIFELVYFSRPDSYVFSRSVYTSRLNLGVELAKEKKVNADMVMPVPDSANMQAMGYSNESGIPLGEGLIRNHYIGRTFIEPHQKIRDFRVKIKLTPVKEALKGKKVAVIDDSIVRGTTARKLVGMIRGAGAKEIHLLIASPPIKYSCYYGIDTPDEGKLIANRFSVKETKKYLGVDSLHYLSAEGMLRACGGGSYCRACFNGDYPLDRNAKNKYLCPGVKTELDKSKKNK